jgi:hypothetical protein
MTLADINNAFNVSLADILAEFELPADTPEAAQVKDLEREILGNEPAGLAFCPAAALAGADSSR